MFHAILRDADLTRKFLEAILDSPSGRRSLSRLARTCHAFCEPALNVLWRELDSFAPLVGLFPNLMRKAHKPNQGLVKAPGKGDWSTFDKYNERVRRITYDERTSAVVASIFPMLAENKPQEYILPFLEELTWKVQTAAGLKHCEMFLNPGLQALHLEIGVRLPQLDFFLQNLSKHTRLSTFSFSSPTTLPDVFTDLLHNQKALEKVVLGAPGALSPSIGRWLESLEHLKQLQLDLSGRSVIAVEGFFDELVARSGYSTPSSMAASDDEEEYDFSEIRRSALKLTGDLPSKGIFHQLRRLQLTGEASNISAFLKNITSPLTHMDLVIEDPPDRADWQDLCALLCERFRDSLLSLRITATSSSRFTDLYLVSLPNLVRLEIDLPESVIFTSADFSCLAQSTPRLELLRLCPQAKFPAAFGAPQATLDDLALLLGACQNLHTITAVIDAKPINEEILAAREMSSNSLLRLHVGHSWVGDPLRVAISLSHIAPRLESLKWFQEKTRQGYVEANAKTWQSLSDFLPHFQNIRLVERNFARTSPPIPPRHEREGTYVDKGVGITVVHVDRSIDAEPFTVNSSVQVAPLLMDRVVEAKPTVFSASVDATPLVSYASIDATVTKHEQSIDATVPASDKTQLGRTTEKERNLTRKPQTLDFSYIYHVFSFFCRFLILYPFTVPSRIVHLAMGSYMRWSQGPRLPPKRPSTETMQRSSQNGIAHNRANGDAIPLNTVPVGQ